MLKPVRCLLYRKGSTQGEREKREMEGERGRGETDREGGREWENQTPNNISV